MHRTLAIIERELRRFRRSPMLIVMSMIFPLVQLVVLGYAFGGNVKHLKVGDRRSGPRRAGGQDPRAGRRGRRPARARSTSSTTPTGRRRSTDLRNGRVNGVLTIPPDFSRRVLGRNAAARRADRGQHRQLRRRRRWPATVERAGRRPSTQPATRAAHRRRRRRSTSSRSIPYVPYIQYLLPGSIVDVDLHDGDDRRRHHLHRRQGARAARGLPRHADHASSS